MTPDRRSDRRSGRRKLLLVGVPALLLLCYEVGALVVVGAAVDGSAVDLSTGATSLFNTIAMLVSGGTVRIAP